MMVLSEHIVAVVAVVAVETLETDVSELKLLLSVVGVVGKYIVSVSSSTSTSLPIPPSPNSPAPVRMPFWRTTRSAAPYTLPSRLAPAFAYPDAPLLPLLLL